MDLQDKRGFLPFSQALHFSKIESRLFGGESFCCESAVRGWDLAKVFIIFEKSSLMGRGMLLHQTHSLGQRIMHDLLVAQTWGPSSSVKMVTGVIQLTFPNRWMQDSSFALPVISRWSSSPCVQSKDWWNGLAHRLTAALKVSLQWALFIYCSDCFFHLDSLHKSSSPSSVTK